MTRKIIALIFAGCFILGLVACERNTTVTPAPTTDVNQPQPPAGQQ